jgi:hypothetical protein
MARNRNPRLHWRRALLATTAALSFGAQNAAWATCLDGTTFPAGGYQIGKAPVKVAANWSPNVFTSTEGSNFIPDVSTNDQTTGAPTGGGHNWAFDQGSTLCKLGDAGNKAGTVTNAWILPPSTSQDCIVLPIIKNGKVTNLGDIPFQGAPVTPVCDPTKLSGFTITNPDGTTTTTPIPNPANSYANQLGCGIAAFNNGGVPMATTAATATSYMFVAGIKGGLFHYELDNNGPIGKTVGSFSYYSDIPEGLKLQAASVSPDGQFAMAISNRRSQAQIWACIDPLGNPGDPGKPLDPGFFVPDASSVFCGGIGQSGLATNLASTFGPDGQPYIGGQRVVNTFLNTPGGTQGGAWPQCIHLGGGPIPAGTTAAQLHDLILADLSSSAYQVGGSAAQNVGRTTIANTANKCGTMTANAGFTSALITQPSSLTGHVAADGTGYIYTGPLGGLVIQAHLGKDLVGRTTYKTRTYLSGISLSTGLGVADDLGSLMVQTDPSAVGLSGQEVITKTPLCEDMQ